MMIRVNQIEGYIFFVTVRISWIYFFLASLMRINVETPLELLISNCKNL